MNEVPTGPTVEDHASYLGASDIGAVVGVGSFSTALDIWARKTGKVPPFEGNIHTDIGNAFERPALAIYAKRHNHVLTFPGTLFHPVEKWAGATPDGIADDRMVAECKIVGFGTNQKWGKPEEGADAVPPEVYCQVHWQSWIVRTLGIAPCETADVVVVGGTEQRVYPIEIDEVFIKHLRAIGKEFWERHVLGNVMPEVTERDGDTLQDIYPKHGGELALMTDEVEGLAREYNDAKESATVADNEKKRVAAKLKALIGNGIGFRGNGVKATWRAPKGSPRWKGVAESAGSRLDHHIYNMIVKDNTPEFGSRKIDVRIK